MNSFKTEAVGHIYCGTQSLKVLRSDSSPDSDSHYLCAIGQVT